MMHNRRTDGVLDCRLSLRERPVLSRSERRQCSARSAFTLIELLVVIAILMVLAALVSWGVFAMIGRRHAGNTEATIKTVKKLVDGRWKAVITSARKETPSPAAYALAGGDKDRAQVIWIKVRLMEAFPQNYAEVQDAVAKKPTSVLYNMIPAGQYKSHFAKYTTTFALKTGGGPGESSACLLIALKTLSAEGGVTSQDQLSHALGTTDGVNQIDVLLDSWGNPLLFSRFSAVNSANPAAAGTPGFKYSDPIDPNGTLLNQNWYAAVPPPNPTLRQQFEFAFHPIARDNVPNANFVIPVIASLGKDATPGTGDDIYSYNLNLD